MYKRAAKYTLRTHTNIQCLVHVLHIQIHIRAHISTHSKLSGARAREGSGNEKLHYFLMYLLIDQSRKGSAPPTPRPPLPSVNQSRNNLMIGAPVPLSRPIRRSFASGIIMTPRFGKSFSSSHARLFSPSFRASKGTVSERRERGRALPIWKADAEEKSFCGIDRVLAIDSHVNRLAREGLVWGIARPDGREKSRTFPSRHFTRMQRALIRKYFAQEFTNEINRERWRKDRRLLHDGFEGHYISLDYPLDPPSSIVSRL